MNKGTIIRVVGGLFYVYDNHQVIKCVGSGKLRDYNITPIAGDDVLYEVTNQDEGYIKEVLPRKNYLIRPPVANIDQAIIVMSLKEPEFSSLMLEKYLLQIHDHEIEPIIYFSKIDKVTNLNKYQEKMKDYLSHGYKIYYGNSLLKDSNKQFNEILKDKKSILTGQSGAGKSEFLNSLDQKLNLKTGDYSFSLGRGKHTTREVEFIEVYGGFLADTPGFSSLNLEIEPQRLASIYPCLKEYAFKCKFRGCLHQEEPGCKVKEAISNGLISEELRQNYLKVLHDSNELIKKRGK